MRFVADVMLGKLAKWLRVLGFDTLYRSFDPIEPVAHMSRKGRIPLTRQKKLVSSLFKAVHIEYDNVGDQLNQLKEAVAINTFHSEWFCRCIRCNSLLKDANIEAARDSVPEYVFYRNFKRIRFCATCGKYFWPGSHRTRMEKQLSGWGFFNWNSDIRIKKNWKFFKKAANFDFS